MVDCYIALGSNLGDRLKNIDLCLKYLEQNPAIEILKVSSFFESEPQESVPGEKFLNGVAKIQTDYSAQRLLKILQEIEVRLRRQASHPKNQPRTIDLDILLYGNSKINETNLQIPHPRMWQRKFVRKPLQEIAPELFDNVP
ncbi:MAG: 2-amino-4-hydroxy-6-hydroxymethyldihydropteridine diphosphokinase [Candidatus Omnitrophica bacterium]|nr:2-amino-4-hydroxy-6-hydroxymethyldihydropteridine diphosphokinase [Candidatus Omnitrophota bacterium]